MQKPIVAMLVKAILPCMLLCGIYCSSKTGDPLAGGSGAGNPAGNVIVSMYAVNDQGLAKSLLEIPERKDSAFFINIRDNGVSQFTVSSISIAHVALHFVLDSIEKPDRLLSSMDRKPPELSCDTNSFILNVPSAFDLLKGSRDSSITTWNFPDAHYSGVSLDFGSGSAPNVPMQDQIILNGSFLYKGTMHDMIVAIANPEFSYVHHYRFGGGIFTLSLADTIHLQLQFNSNLWFANVDIAHGLNNGLLDFDSTGTLKIESYSQQPFVRAFGMIIARDFLASGRLVVY